MASPASSSKTTSPRTAAGRALLHIHGEAMREPVAAIEAEATAEVEARWWPTYRDETALQRVVEAARIARMTLEREEGRNSPAALLSALGVLETSLDALDNPVSEAERE